MINFGGFYFVSPAARGTPGTNHGLLALQPGDQITITIGLGAVNINDPFRIGSPHH